ncbi:ABC transporter permease [Actinomadura sp. WMMB 499]|uniref:ABC transporter permease n=1 Tax=Actinomadura sp. WMMB 499 TaxID=1219491 RepID=UPI0012489EE5|nr:ABC transporter permease [Actinomadura sp. WMMB 499]QFG20261.1 ABC transporter permease [Actinomadura sp. WMMB 499]
MSALTGTRGLVRLILRRDRFLLPIWIIYLGMVPSVFASATAELYPAVADRQEYAEISGNNPAYIALFGPLYSESIGGIITQRLGLIPLVVGLISMLTVIRHTRTDEAAGRRELLGSTAVSRHAPLAAALIVVAGANLLLALVMIGGLSGQDLPTAGTVALALQFAAGGCLFAAVGALAAQFSTSAGGARAIGFGALGAALLLRIAGDSGGVGWLSWLSPIGWVHRLRPFAGERWWVLLIIVAAFAAIVAASVALSARRDVGAGALAPRPGPAEASAGLRSPLGLAWRLHRAPLLGWTAGFVVIGAVLGGVAEGVSDMMRDNESLSDVFTRMGGAVGIRDAFLSSMMGLFGLIAAAYAIQAALRMRAEENELRADPVLGTAVGRLQWAGGHLLFSLLGPAVVLTAAGLAAGLTHGLNTGDVGRELPRVLGGSLVQLPAVWVLAGLTIALFGLLPRFTMASWGALALFVLLGQIGSAMQLSQAALDVSPFTHIPKLPGGEMSVQPLVWLGVIAALLVVAGTLRLRTRDIKPAA